MALAATGLEPLFQAIGLDTDLASLQRAMHWLKRQGADKVADLNQLPPGTYRCSKLADNLGLPMLKAQRLLSALEGTKSSAIHRDVCDSPLHGRCSAAALAAAAAAVAACCASETSPTAQYSERPV